MVSREIAVVLALVSIQLLWTQLFPLLRSVYVDVAAPWVQDVALPWKWAAGRPEFKRDVRWLPALDPETPDISEFISEDPTILPLFPLGTVFYAPLSTGVQLKIFEPRYQQMYEDIMAEKSPRFMVTAVSPDTGQFAEAGVIFHVDKLNDVSAPSGNQIKYVASHTVVGRAKIRQVLNPSAWAHSSTYLRAEVTPLEDDSSFEDLAELEVSVRQSFEEIVQVQSAEDSPLVATRDGLWQLADIWINQYLPSSLNELQSRLQKELQQLSRVETRAEAAESAEEMQSKLSAAWTRAVSEQVTLGQSLLQSKSHRERLAALRAAFQPFD